MLVLLTFLRYLVTLCDQAEAGDYSDISPMSLIGPIRGQFT